MMASLGSFNRAAKVIADTDSGIVDLCAAYDYTKLCRRDVIGTSRLTQVVVRTLTLQASQKGNIGCSVERRGPSPSPILVHV